MAVCFAANDLGKFESLNAEQVGPCFGWTRRDEFEIATDGSATGDGHRKVAGMRDRHVAPVAGFGFSICASDDLARAERSFNYTCAASAAG